MAQTPQPKEAFEAFTAGDYRTALKLYTEALDANPADTAAIFYQGLCYFSRLPIRFQNSAKHRFSRRQCSFSIASASCK
ncbi:MAG: hypothetical protein ACRENG_08480 [bacterium]